MARKKKEHDFAVNAFRVMQEATEEAEEAQAEQPEPPIPEGKNPDAVRLGRLGGKRGGKARAEKLSPERRREIARKAAQTRWNNRQ